ncbi:MAG: plasmid mobilization relaxosome protein MobC [Eubacteriales bacterium]
MDNLSKNQRIYIKVSETEKELMPKRMETAGMTNLSEFVRRMVLYGYILEVDMSPLNDIYKELGYIGRNLNQITRRSHETGNVYGEDIRGLRDDLVGISEKLATFFDGIEGVGE